MKTIFRDFSSDELMNLAISEARNCLKHDDVPVGAILLNQKLEIVGRGHNKRELRQLASSHAEIVAIDSACKKLGTWNLAGCTLVVTLEPCPMCAGAIVNSRISKVIFGCHDPKAGSLGSLYNFSSDPRLNHNFIVESGVLATECSNLLTSFFSEKRR